ncbi:hypothetical protein ABW19_dt0209660 [Dactylella cylindrospora]|nr:hypothetical protein ABW19_dt0209660 [Dactylella cylindrospora]
MSLKTFLRHIEASPQSLLPTHQSQDSTDRRQEKNHYDTMSSPRSVASFQNVNLIAQALSVSDSSWSTISDNSLASQTHDAGTKPFHPPNNSATASAHFANETLSDSVRKSQRQHDPLGNVSGPASPKPSAAPPHLQSNTSPSPPPPSTASRSSSTTPSLNIDLLVSHTAFSTADTPVPYGYDAVSYLSIALFIPSAHFPELLPSTSTAPVPAGELGFRGDERYPIRRYMAESFTEDPYPLRCRMHLRT